MGTILFPDHYKLNTMCTILQIETATQSCSAAISRDGETIALKEIVAQNVHAASLTLFIDEVMGMADMQYPQLDAVAVSKGPGSYTGLRIGVSTAKGLCFALDKPLIGIDTLKMMADGFFKSNPDYQGLVCPMIDARRLEVYTALFNNRMEMLEPVSAKIIDEKSFQEVLQSSEVTFIGDGSSKCKDLIHSEKAQFSTLNFNSAANMSGLAFKAFNARSFEDVAYFEPFYLKDFVLTQSKKKV
jgi:tRNA threonylcarbamoyladenosine biosynthesis protein TsaB